MLAVGILESETMNVKTITVLLGAVGLAIGTAVASWNSARRVADERSRCATPQTEQHDVPTRPPRYPLAHNPT